MTRALSSGAAVTSMSNIGQHVLMALFSQGREPEEFAGGS